MRVLHYDAAVTASLKGHQASERLSARLADMQVVAPPELSDYLFSWLRSVEEFGLDERLVNTRLSIDELLAATPLLETMRSRRRRWDLRRALPEDDHRPYAALAWALGVPLLVTSEEAAENIQPFCAVERFIS